MRILILRSQRPARGERPKDPYTQEFGSAYAERVIGNLVGEEGFCGACGPECNACRKAYARTFGRDIAGVIGFPGALDYLLERPAEYVPRQVPPHEILLAINIHDQILIEVLRRCRQWGTRGVVVPVEAPGWVHGSTRAEAESICQAADIEIALPKPFCDFDPPAPSLLAEFRRRFHIGKPHVELTVQDERIARAHVEVSAACGATYYVARWLAGRRLDDDLKYEVVAKRLHSYPCTASMEWDEEIGDTIMHVAGQAHYEILTPLRGETPSEPGMVRSPVGRMVPKPARAHENVEKIEQAKEAILAELAAAGAVCLERLRSMRKITPAAGYSALLLLEREGKVRTEGGKIMKA